MSLIILITMGLCQWHWVPWFVLPGIILCTFSRWAFAIHTQTHKPGRCQWLAALMPLVFSPLSVGLNEQRSVHLGHHELLGTAADPDWLFYDAHPIKAFALCCLHPEITFWRSAGAMNWRSWCGVCLRAVLFFSLWTIAGSNFLLWYLLPIRLLFGTAQFVFTWCLHHRPEERTIDIHLPPCFTVLIGKVGMKELGNHAKHHQLQT